MSNTPLIIDYYTDILCVWAWIAQRRIDELNVQLGSKIELYYHYIDLFGDTETRMRNQWVDKGMYDGFGDHVAHAAAPFETAPVNPDIWHKVRPTTSANAHLVIKAVELAYGTDEAVAFALVLRKAFFVEAQDISNLKVLCGLVKQQGLDDKPINEVINKGSAIAELMGDYQRAKQQGIKGSPSYVMDKGRQTLYGNVGYRVLHANIEELLKNPMDEASWC